jgi:hypothetical protein
MGGGAWPFLVGGVICLLNCDNERDLYVLVLWLVVFALPAVTSGQTGITSRKFEAITGL